MRDDGDMIIAGLGKRVICPITISPLATRWESRKEKREGGGSGVAKDDILCVSSHYFQLDVVEFNSSWLQGLVRVQSSFEAVGNLASDANLLVSGFPGCSRA